MSGARIGAVTAVAVAVLAAGALPGSAAAPKGAKVRQLVVFKDGTGFQRKVRARAVRVTVESRRCALARSTALAALVRSRPGIIGFEDFGSCSLRARDSGQIYVKRIRSDREAGAGGWVYKVGRKLATAGAADVAGPFGTGRLRSGQRVLWFYCVLESGSCQRTLSLKLIADAGGVVRAIVRSHDDAGAGRPEPAVTVSGSGASATTDSTGTAVLEMAPGPRRLTARKAGLIRSYTERVTVIP